MSALHDLAERMGIVAEYVDQSGTERRPTSDATRVALLSAMGLPGVADGEGADEGACRTALAELDAEDANLPLPPAAVLRAGDAATLRLRVAPERAWTLTVQLEDGETRERSGRGAGPVLLGPLPLGYHELTVVLDDGTVARQRRIVVPERCPTVAERTGQERAFGLTVQLYAVRSGRNWGIGDFADLETLSVRAAAWNAVFVGLNPLHALDNVGQGISPYSPSRRIAASALSLSRGVRQRRSLPHSKKSANASTPTARRTWSTRTSA